MSGRVWLVEEFGRGGIARYAVDVANLLAADYDVAVATAAGGPSPGLDAPHAVWFATGTGTRVAKARAGLAALAAVPRRLRRGDVAWMPLGVRPAFELALAVAVRLRGARLVVTLHNRAPHGRRTTSPLVLAAARVAHRTVVHSTELLRWARDRRLPAVWLPFPPPREDAGGPAGRHDRASLGAGAGDVLVALVGNLYAYKGVDVLLDAAVSARRDGLGLRLVLAGQPQAGADLAAEVAARGLSACTTLLDGYVEPGELVDVLDAADAVALPYRRIDHSGVGALAAARGVPAVASDLPALRELFGEAASYAPPGDVEGLATALRALPADLPRLRAAAAARDRPDLVTPYRALVAGLLAGGREPGAS